MNFKILGVDIKIFIIFLFLIAMNVKVIYSAPEALHCIDYSANDASIFFNNIDDGSVNIELAKSFRKDELIFKVSKCVPGDTLRFVGDRRDLEIEPYYSYDRISWIKIEDVTIDYGLFKFGFRVDENKVFIALVPESKGVSEVRAEKLEYPYEKITAYVDSVRVLPEVDSKKIGTSVEGRDIYKFTIANNNISDENKKNVWLNFRVHGDEATQSFVLEGVIAFLLGGSSESKELLERTVYHIVPLINPDGAFNNERENANGIDLNRNWSSPDTVFDEQLEVAAVHNEITSVITRDAKKISHVVDFHGWDRAADGGFRSHYNAGVCSVDKSYYNEQKSYVDLIKKNDAWQSYWEYTPGKITMARIAMYKEHGLSVITQEYPSAYRSDSTQVTSEQFREQGVENLRSIDQYVFPISFIDDNSNHVSDYYKDDLIHLVLNDYDAGIASKSKKNSYMVTLYTTSGDSEEVMLTETGDTTGIFVDDAGISFEMGDITVGDGTLQIGNNSEVCGVIYSDSDYVDGISWDYVTLNTGDTPLESIAQKTGSNLAIKALIKGNEIIISFNGISVEKSLKLSIYSLNGRVIKQYGSKEIDKGIIRLGLQNNLAKGLYYCQIIGKKINKQIPLLLK